MNQNSFVDVVDVPSLVLLVSVCLHGPADMMDVITYCMLETCKIFQSGVGCGGQSKDIWGISNSIS